MKNKSLFSFVLIAILGAWAIVLRMFDFPILPAAPFLKIDFSDLMVLIGLLVKGPIGAVGVAFVRDLANYLMKGGEGGIPIGTAMSFIASMAMFLPNHFLLKHFIKKSKWASYGLMSLVLSTGLVLSMALFNYYIALPIYVTVMNFPIDDIGAYLMTVIIPFNLIKAVFLSIGQIVVIEKIWPLITKRHIQYPAYPIQLKQDQLKLQSHG